jgi:ABC-type transport system involved in cytochrome bd biosynthesis fused ATPase/permease subunit
VKRAPKGVLRPDRVFARASAERARAEADETRLEAEDEDTVIYGQNVQNAKGMIALFGGPAGAGKSTLARAWCATRPQAAHIELDEIRHPIISGRADPQETSELQEAQYRLSVEATCALARAFANGG